MPYSLKVTGITETQKILKDTVQHIKLKLEKIGDTRISINIPNTAILVEIEKDQVSGLLKTLPSIMKKAHKNAVKQLVELLEIALNDAMESPVWDWNGDQRDIVDTGALKKSLKIYVDSDDDIHIMYGEDYAAIVHYGGYFNPYGNKTVKQYYPGRPWVSAVLAGGGPVPQFNFQSEYTNLLTAELYAKLG